MAGRRAGGANVAGDGPAPQGNIARLVIWDGGHYLHALAADGRKHVTLTAHIWPARSSARP
jgi:lauroyl/myristoyl acyltransferase